jgi:lysophospholipase L1-like esterase
VPRRFDSITGGTRRAANRLVAEVQRGGAHQKFVDVFSAMLARDGKPLAELFRDDLLHLNEQGYKHWAELLKPLLK